MRIRRGPATVTGEAEPHGSHWHRDASREGAEGRPGSQETSLRPQAETPSRKGVAPPDEDPIQCRPGGRPPRCSAAAGHGRRGRPGRPSTCGSKARGADAVRRPGHDRRAPSSSSANETHRPRVRRHRFARRDGHRRRRRPAARSSPRRAEVTARSSWRALRPISSERASRTIAGESVGVRPATNVPRRDTRTASSRAWGRAARRALQTATTCCSPRRRLRAAARAHRAGARPARASPSACG